jgi:transporter family protein
MWAILAIVAALLLGIYDVFKKVSLNNNAVLPTLLFSVSTSALIFTPVIIGSIWYPDFFKTIGFYSPTLSIHEHLLVFIKSTIVVSSWILAFFAVKHLPLTIVAPIRASGPIWTLLGAVIIFSERPNSLQWTGLVITLIFFYLFSTTGKLEGINFRKNKWVFFIIAATLLGTVSGLYDKYIIRTIDRVAVQTWFSVYQVVIMLPITAIIWYPHRKKYTPFKWRWSIPFIGIFLILTDYFYFYAISEPDSLISVIAGIRRSGIIVAFAFGAIFLKEKNIRKKGIYLSGIIIGVILMALGSH